MNAALKPRAGRLSECLSLGDASSRRARAQLDGAALDLPVIERNVRRLRDQLASAWDTGRSPAVIRRLEEELRLWWRRREAARRARVNSDTQNPTPA